MIETEKAALVKVERLLRGLRKRVNTKLVSDVSTKTNYSSWRFNG